MSFSPGGTDLELAGSRTGEPEVPSGDLDGFHEQLAHLVGLLGQSEELGFIVDMGDLDVVLALDQAPLLGFPVEDDRGEFHEDGPGTLEQGVQGSMVGADVKESTIDPDQVLALELPIRPLVGQDLLDGYQHCVGP